MRISNLGFILPLILSLNPTYQEFCEINGKFGHDCRQSCRCTNNTYCNNVTGNCVYGCLPGWSGPSCQKQNIAFKSSTFQKDGHGSVDSGLAVDGNMETCSKSKDGVSGWWTLGLKQKHVINNIEITTDNKSSLHGWRIQVGEDSNIFNMRTCATIKIFGHSARVTCDTRESIRYISVINPKGPVSFCEFKVFACSMGTFGMDCEFECACVDPTEQCDLLYGTCDKSGCRAGRTGADCQKDCISSYGPNCVHRCGSCVNGSICNPVSGLCHHGCQIGWQGLKCDKACIKGHYGNNCSEECGHCYSNDTCHPVNGICSNGCNAGWTGDQCKNKCRIGRYGENCAFSCGHCKAKSCNTYTGRCEECAAGWKGIFCTQKCEKGRYGYGCAHSCPNCHLGQCHHVHGVCQAQCNPGWIGSSCNKSCSEGQYGMGCNMTCGRCIDHSCDKSNGTCKKGCQSGYTGIMCDTECPDGFYGMDCINQCGSCYERAPCNKFTGICDNGCFDGYSGLYCSKDEVVFSDMAGSHLDTFLGISLTIVGGTLFLVILCLVAIWRQEDVLDVENENQSQKFLQHNEI